MCGGGALLRRREFLHFQGKRAKNDWNSIHMDFVFLSASCVCVRESVLLEINSKISSSELFKCDFHGNLKC